MHGAPRRVHVHDFRQLAVLGCSFCIIISFDVIATSVMTLKFDYDLQPRTKNHLSKDHENRTYKQAHRVSKTSGNLSSFFVRKLDVV